MMSSSISILTILLILNQMSILSRHFRANSLIRIQTRWCAMPMMAHIRLVVLTRLFLFYFTLQIMNLIMRWSVMRTDLWCNWSRILNDLVRLLKSNIFVKLCFGTAIFVDICWFSWYLMISLNNFTLLVNFFFLGLFVWLHDNII